MGICHTRQEAHLILREGGLYVTSYYITLAPLIRTNPLIQVWLIVVNFYASAFRRRSHYVFGLSVRPSVRPKPEIPSFDLYMGPLVHPTNRNRFTACPSVPPSVRQYVRPSVRRGFRAFAGERMEGMARNFAHWCILSTFRTDKFMATVCWFL